MAYSEELAERIRAHLEGNPKIDEKKMFGGLAFLLSGNMSVGIIGDELMVRVGKDAHDEMVALPGARIMDFTGQEMKGWLVVGTPGIKKEEALGEWVERGVTFASSLPAK